MSFRDNINKRKGVLMKGPIAKDSAILDMLADEIEVSPDLIADNTDYVDYLLNERKDGFDGIVEPTDVVEFDDVDDEWYLD
jgi:uncharacterized protein with ATP-grasp and redox domains|tara:strand:- start:1466 stop:1708 length:243 start_codon:yes stop_codon:yes gene_type:complete